LINKTNSEKKRKKKKKRRRGWGPIATSPATGIRLLRIVPEEIEGGWAGRSIGARTLKQKEGEKESIGKSEKDLKKERQEGNRKPSQGTEIHLLGLNLKGRNCEKNGKVQRTRADISGGQQKADYADVTLYGKLTCDEIKG